VVLYFNTSGFNQATMKYDPNFRFSHPRKPSIDTLSGNRVDIFTNAFKLCEVSLAFLFYQPGTRTSLFSWFIIVMSSGFSLLALQGFLSTNGI
jgi:hypothetical protein